MHLTYIVLAICVPKIVKGGRNLTKLWQKSRAVTVDAL